MSGRTYTTPTLPANQARQVNAARPVNQARPAGEPAQLAAELDALLTASLEENKGLLELAARHRAALRRADGAAAHACAEEQDGCLRRLADLDRRRLELIAAFGRARAGQKPPSTISDLAESVAEPERTRLREKATAVRELMARIRGEYQTIQIATRSLLAHMEGLMRQVGRQLSQSGTYGRRGYVEAGAAACAIDLTR
ncbi:MAG: flagellar export chaperone FlgN [Phycisphaerales bacterium]|nr:flagellar export chaperone FlgN [Phycisphaerales bacterium]